MRSVRLALVFGCGLAVISCAAPVHGQNALPRVQSSAQTDSEMATVDNHWVRTIREDLVAEKFDELEAMATQYRTSKSRVPGGDWQLHLFYAALHGSSAGDPDMPAHLAHLQRWMAAKPQSITPAIAYAGSMTNWAWQARTNAQADKVTDEGWRLFKERAAGARAALDAVAHQPLDGQWFGDYMTVALAQDWDNDRMKALFQKASAAFPGYFYLYEQYSNYLLPKWDGKPGEAAQFAKTSADAIGGPDGDLLYFQIGAGLLGRSNGNSNASTLDWPRLQSGHSALAAKYGTTNRVENQFALMAFREKDAAIAQAQFARIGDRMATSVWKNRAQFDRAREWAGGTAPAATKGLIPLGP